MKKLFNGFKTSEKVTWNTYVQQIVDKSMLGQSYYLKLEFHTLIN